MNLRSESSWIKVQAFAQRRNVTGGKIDEDIEKNTERLIALYVSEYGIPLDRS